jgi:hypothetical protein
MQSETQNIVDYFFSNMGHHIAICENVWGITRAISLAKQKREGAS